MGFLGRLKEAFTPAKVTGGIVVQDKPLHDQVSRIGGGVTPQTVSGFLRMADAGQPERLIDLFNESRQRDGHLQSVCGTRDGAVALCDIDFRVPVDATPEEKEAADICRRAVDDFKNWSELVEHLTSAYVPGHATSVLDWAKTKDGWLLPYRAKNVPAREFIFNLPEGALRHRRYRGDHVGVDLLAENPGRIVQIQRRIVGDAPCREGLKTVLVWSALFRNWDLRDWLALGELGWKPYLLAKYKPGTHQKEIDKLLRVLEAILKNGYAAIPTDSEVNVEWPKGTGPTGQSSHRELFDVIGREMSKAVLGQTTSVEAGPSGDRGGVSKRDELRTDLREGDARAVAGVLRYHFFAPVVALNCSPKCRVPVPYFQTEESANQKEFSDAIGNVVDHGLRVPAKWVRDEMGMPAPLDGEECLTPRSSGQVPGDVGGDDDDEDLKIPVTVEGEEDDDDDAKGAANRHAFRAAAPAHGDRRRDARPGRGRGRARASTRKSEADDLPEAGSRDGLEYADRLTESSAAAGAKALASTVAAMVTVVAKAKDYDEAARLVEERYGTLLEPTELKVVTESALSLSQLAGYAAVRQDTPELEEAKPE